MQRRLITCLGFLLICLAGATSAWAASGDMWAEGNDYVRLETANANNQHPTSFSTEQLTILLGQFYKRDRKKDPAPYFSQDEISRLAEKLVPLFAKAKPGEDIEFGTSFRPGGFMLLPRALNAGRLFVENGQMNLLIGMCAEEQNAGYQQAFGTSRPLNHGSRSKPVDTLKCELQAGNAAERVGNRTDWIRLNINVALTTPAAPLSPNSTPLTFGASAILAPAAKSVPAPTPAPAVKPETSVSPTTPASQAEERLILIKRLHDKGLITDTEYEQGRAAVLKSL